MVNFFKFMIIIKKLLASGEFQSMIFSGAFSHLPILRKSHDNFLLILVQIRKPMISFSSRYGFGSRWLHFKLSTDLESCLLNATTAVIPRMQLFLHRVGAKFLENLKQLFNQLQLVIWHLSKVKNFMRGASLEANLEITKCKRSGFPSGLCPYFRGFASKLTSTQFLVNLYFIVAKLDIMK